MLRSQKSAKLHDVSDPQDFTVVQLCVTASSLLLVWMLCFGKGCDSLTHVGAAGLGSQLCNRDDVLVGRTDHEAEICNHCSLPAAIE